MQFMSVSDVTGSFATDRVQVSHIDEFATQLVYLSSETLVRSYIVHLCKQELHFSEDHTILLL